MGNIKIIEKKSAVVDEIVDNIQKSSAVVFFDNSNLSVADVTEIRRSLREANADLKVYKNTLSRRAFEQLKLEGSDLLVGPRAMVYGEDTVAPVKIISEAAKKYENLEMKVGIIDGKLVDISVINKIASLPNRETLLTQIASGLMGAVRNFAICVDLHAKNLEEK